MKMTAATQLNQLTVQAGGRVRESLTLQPLPYIVYDYKRQDSWVNQIGEAALATWHQLTTMIDRSQLAQSKYGNLYTVPMSLKRTAELLGMSTNKFNKRIRTLWNAGLVDFAEWETQYRIGQQVLNLVVYPYPYGDKQYYGKPLPMDRDYDKDYVSPARSYRKEGMAKAVKVAKQAEIFNQVPSEYLNELEVPPLNEELNYDFYDDAVAAFYSESDTPAIPFSDVTAIQQTEQPAIPFSEYPAISETEYNNIYNTSFNNTNTQVNNANPSCNIFNTNKLDTPNFISNTNIIDTSNSFISSSSSITMSEVKEDEESKKSLHTAATKEISKPIYDVKFSMINDLVRMILEERNVSARRIEAVIKEMNAAGIEVCNPEIINKQLDIMSEKENRGETIFKYGTYFTNGVIDQLENQKHLATNTFGENSDRSVRQFMQAQGIIPQNHTRANVVPFYNWLDERE